MHIFVDAWHPVVQSFITYFSLALHVDAEDKVPIRVATQNAINSLPARGTHGELELGGYTLNELWDKIETIANRTLSLEKARRLKAAREDLDRNIELYSKFESELTFKAQTLTTLILGSKQGAYIPSNRAIESLLTKLVSSRNLYLRTPDSTNLESFVELAEAVLESPIAVQILFANRSKAYLHDTKVALDELKTTLSTTA